MRAALPEELPDVADCKLVTLRVERQLMGIPVQHLRDVLKIARVTRVPLAPPEVSGVMNLRGRIVTVIDMRARLCLPPAGNYAPDMLIVVEQKGEYFGLKADAIGEVLTVPLHAIEKKPSNLPAAWRDIASGVYRLPEELLVTVDIGALLAPQSLVGDNACR